MYKHVNYALRCRFRLAKCGACKTKDLRHKLVTRQCAFGFCGLSGSVGVTVGNHSTVQNRQHKISSIYATSRWKYDEYLHIFSISQDIWRAQ